MALSIHFIGIWACVTVCDSANVCHIGARHELGPFGEQTIAAKSDEIARSYTVLNIVIKRCSPHNFPVITLSDDKYIRNSRFWYALIRPWSVEP